MFADRTLVPESPKTSNKRAAEVLAAGELFANFGGPMVARQVIAENGTVADFHRRIAPRIHGAGSFDRAMGCTFSNRDLSRYSLVDLVMRRGGLEREVAGQIAKDTGLIRDGHPIPWSVLTRDFGAGTAGEAGNLIESGARPTEYLRDPLRARLTLAQLGAMVTPGFVGDFSLPRISSDASVSFVGELSALSETQPGTSLVTFSARRLGGYVEVSKAALTSGGPAVEAWLTRVLLGIVLAQMEWSSINGTGTGNFSLGVRNTPGIGLVTGGTNGAQLTWTHLVDLENAVGLANGDETEFAGYLTNTKVRRLTKVTPKAANLDFMWAGGDRPLNGHRAAITANVPGNLDKGTSTGVCSSVVYSSDWTSLLVPIFGAPEIIADHLSLAKDGMVRIIINAWMSSGVLQPGNFSKMDDALTA